MTLKWKTKLFSILSPLKKYLLSNQSLYGDRDVEWSFVGAHIQPMESGATALDFGPQNAYLGLMAAEAGYKTIAVDLQDIKWPYQHTNLRFIRSDILTLALPENYFDLIINCSSIEHVGLAGRYNITKNQKDGDLIAMQKLYTLMKHGGKMLLTLPVGMDSVFQSLHRVYGASRLPLLIKQYTTIKKEFWLKNSALQWTHVDEAEALAKPPQADLYGLGCFVLEKPISAS